MTPAPPETTCWETATIAALPLGTAHLMIFTNKPDMHKQTCATSPTAGWSQQKNPYKTLPTTQNLKSTMGALNTSTLGDKLHEDFRAGVIMVDLFGGMAAGLEAHLRTGTKIFKYVYVDIDDKDRKMAKHRLNELHELHPDQLPRRAFSQAFTTLNQDVNKIDRENLLQAGAANPLRRWMIVAGWPCQDLSPAGSMQGLQGPRVTHTTHSSGS